MDASDVPEPSSRPAELPVASSACITRRRAAANAAESRSRGRGSATASASGSRPGRGGITITRSANSTASSRSCVTSRTVGRVSCHRSSSSPCRLARVNGSSAENGSSKQQARLPDKRPRDCDPLLLASGQVPRQAVAQSGQPDPVQQHAAAGPAFRLADGTGAERDVGLRRQPQQQPRLLEHGADARVRASIDERAVHRDRASVRLVQPGQQTQQRGLAAAGPADEREYLPGAGLEGDVLQGLRSVRVGLRQRPDLQAAHSRLRPVSCQRTSGRETASSAASHSFPSTGKVSIATRMVSARPICCPSSSR